MRLDTFKRGHEAGRYVVEKILHEKRRMLLMLGYKKINKEMSSDNKTAFVEINGNSYVNTTYTVGVAALSELEFALDSLTESILSSIDEDKERIVLRENFYLADRCDGLYEVAIRFAVVPL